MAILEALARTLSTEASLLLVHGDEDPRIHHEAFWSLFRAGSMLCLALARGGTDPDLRFALAWNQLELSKGLSLWEARDGKTWLKGDTEAAFRLAASARTLFAGIGTPVADALAARAAEQADGFRKLLQAIAESPDAFLVAPIYGPIVGESRSAEASER